MEGENKNIHVLFSTRTEFYPYSEYVDECEVNGIEPDEEYSDAYYNWVSDQIQMNLDDLFDDLNHGKYADKSFAIYGVLDLWDGKHEISPNPHISEGLVETIKKCYKGNSIDDFEISFDEDEGKVIVHAFHHDGTNVFEIKQCSTRWSSRKNMNVLVKTFPMKYLGLFPEDWLKF